MDQAVEAIVGCLAATGPGDPGLRVAIVDGVPNLEHPELGDVDIEIEGTMAPADANGPDQHATEICQLILSSKYGVAKGCSGLILPVFFADSGSSRAPRASQLDIARALYMAVEHGVPIVNVSAGQRASTPEAGRHLEDALAQCSRHRVLVVAAAGNDGCACLHVPAAVATVLAVGAMDQGGRPIAQSNWGESYSANGLLAPGAELEVMGSDGVPVLRTGTSYAAVIVSGVAARLLSAARAHRYPLDAIDIRSVLIDSADPCEINAGDRCEQILAGRMNVEAAIDLLHRRGRGRSKPATTTLQSRPSTRGEFRMDDAMQGGISPATEMPRGPAVASGIAVEQLGCACGGHGTCSCEDQQEEKRIKASGLPPDVLERTALVTQQSCSCGGNKDPQLVYTVGALWFDFGSEARYDAIVQQMNDPVAANTPPVLFQFLSDNLAFASGITFILMQDQIPIYAIQPAGPFALEIYRAMLDAMQTSLDPTGDLQRVAIPGIVAGTTRLTNGMLLPVIYPDLRGMVKWRAQELASSAKAAVGLDTVDEAALFNFLSRVYDELRNLGLSPEDRAMNFAATNAYQAATAFADGVSRHLELFRISVKKSPICRPDSDCWDVQLVMFDPENDRRAGRYYRFTVDVSEVLPVTVGRMRSWAAPLSAI